MATATAMPPANEIDMEKPGKRGADVGNAMRLNFSNRACDREQLA